MPTRNINLTDHYDDYLDKVLASGRYQNASEVVRAGLRLLERQDAEDQAKTDALRSAFKQGQDDYESGRFAVMQTDEDIDHFFDALSAGADRA